MKYAKQAEKNKHLVNIPKENNTYSQMAKLVATLWKLVVSNGLLSDKDRSQTDIVRACIFISRSFSGNFVFIFVFER